MIEIDSDLSASMYPPDLVAHNHGHDRLEREDEQPTGDDYNFLWDAIIDELDAALPELGLDKVKLVDAIETLRRAL
jgi:hypothetical protein